MSTLVRLVEDFPDHSPASPEHEQLESMDESRVFGALVRIGAPIKPDKNWICGTDVIFPVEWMQGIGDLHPDSTGELPFVCRHQIEAGD